MKRVLAVGLSVAVMVLMCWVVSLPTEDVVRLCGHCVQFSQFQAPLVGESAEYRETMLWQRDGETSKLEFSAYLEVIDSTSNTYTVKAWYKVLEASGVYEGTQLEPEETVIDSNTHMIVSHSGLSLCPLLDLDVAGVPIFGRDGVPQLSIIRVGATWENEGINFEACESTFYQGDLVMGIWAGTGNEKYEEYLLLGDEWPITKWPFIRKLYIENRYIGEEKEIIDAYRIMEAWIVSELSQP